MNAVQLWMALAFLFGVLGGSFIIKRGRRSVGAALIALALVAMPLAAGYASQADSQIGANQSGLDYRTADNAGKKALLNHHKGSTAPSYKEAGVIWIDDSATPWLVKAYDGADWITMGAIDATGNTFTPYYGAAAPRVLAYAADTGSANAYVIAPSPSASAYVTGMVVTLKPGNANTTTSTINVSSLGTKTIKDLGGNNLSSGTLVTSGVYILMYDGTNFVLLNSLGSITNIANSQLATMAANTIKANATGSSATPTDLALTASHFPCMGSTGNLSSCAVGTGLSFSGTTLNASSASVDRQTFSGSGTWTKPANGTLCLLRVWGGGGSGGGGTSGGGGGGGAYNERLVLMSSMGSTETVTIGAGGAAVTTNIAGNAGGNTTFGSWVTAYGGGAGQTGNTGGGGGGVAGASPSAGVGGPLVAGAIGASSTPGGDSTFGGGSSNPNPTNVAAALGGSSFWGGGAGGAFVSSASASGGNSVRGGAGGGPGGTTSPSIGGTSIDGGNGGAGGTTTLAGVAGSAKGGGGGGARLTAAGSGAGGAGYAEAICQ